MKTRRTSILRGWLSLVFLGFLGMAATASTLQAQVGKRSSVSKVYFTDVSAETSINNGDQISDVTKRSVYAAQGSVIETRRPATESERSQSYSTMVYSNGTGAFFDADTRVEVRRFVQEPFTPQRTDMDVEPSISQTQAFVSRGTVGLCASKLVAGSNMTYQTPHGSINIRGRKIVIETDDETTKISMLEGESVVRAGPQDMGIHTVGPGQQAIITRGAIGRPNSIRIAPIPPGNMSQLQDQVAMACMAKRTVYFEERPAEVNEDGAEEGAEEGAAAVADEVADTAENGAVTAFDEPAGSGPGTGVREIVPIEIVPGNLPVQFTISPAQILSPGPTPTGG